MYAYTMEYYSAIKKHNELLISISLYYSILLKEQLIPGHVTTCSESGLGLKLYWAEETKQRRVHWVIPFISSSKAGKINI